MNTEPPKKKRLALVLTLLALAAIVCLAATVVMSIPYMNLPTRVEAPTKAATEPATQPEEAAQVPTTEETVAPTVPPAPTSLGRYDFQYNRNNYLLLSGGESYPGVDVSAFQGNIDWQKVADSGIRFAILRLGYRGYGQKGTLVKDEFIDANLEGAQKAGLAIGAYFFSQALNIDEVDEEIEFMLDILGDTELKMPIVFDWEYISDTARTANMDRETLTKLNRHFCNVMVEKGYQPMIYFNWNQANNLMHLSDLEDYPFWLALYTDRMIFPYDIEMWQWTSSGRVPGINGDVDINVYIP